MRLITEEVGRNREGIRLVRNYFMYDDKTNYLVKAQSYYTREEKKLAKLNYKKSNKLWK